jgi:hypothetical protein
VGEVDLTLKIDPETKKKTETVEVEQEIANGIKVTVEVEHEDGKGVGGIIGIKIPF